MPVQEQMTQALANPLKPCPQALLGVWEHHMKSTCLCNPNINKVFRSLLLNTFIVTNNTFAVTEQFQEAIRLRYRPKTKPSY